MVTHLFSPRRHSGEGRNPGKQGYGSEGMAGFIGWRNDGEGYCRDGGKAFSRLRRHSGEGRNPGKRSRGVTEWQVLSDAALGDRPRGCHSRYAGMACLNHWIPACAGMTESWISACACLLQAGRNDEMPVVTAVVISACPRQASMMKKRNRECETGVSQTQAG